MRFCRLAQGSEFFKIRRVFLKYVKKFLEDFFWVVPLKKEIKKIKNSRFF
jgi:hypothetical protein